jgi:hypothetical protein
MHSYALLSILAAAAVTSAAPLVEQRTTAECAGTGAYYVCANNGFRGYCKSDPCDKTWCPDFTAKTCDPITAPKEPDVDPACPAYKPQEKTSSSSTYAPAATPTYLPKTSNSDPTVCAAGTGFFQVCSGNGFRGCCKSDACGKSWCADYKPGTYDPVDVYVPKASSSSSSTTSLYTPTTQVATWTHTPVNTPTPHAKPTSDPTVCAAGTGFFQSCSNGFRGCCKSDACGKAWCADYKVGTYEPVDSAPKASSSSTVSASPSILTATWTHTPANTATPAPKPNNTPVTDPTVCPAGTGYFQSCSNGFRGCCKTDACAKAWCADFKVGTYEPVDASASKPSASTFSTIVYKPAPTSVSAAAPSATNSAPANPPANSDPTVCAAGTGFYQVCASGFKGCCKKDACALGYCPQ